jgi:hypothetical protein
MKDHVVYLDTKAKEFEKLLNNSKSMIIRGATGRKVPYGIVEKGDSLYFINNNGEGKIIGNAIVESVFNSEKMSPEESTKLVDSNQSKLNLTETQYKRWAGKRYLVLIEIRDFKEIKPFLIDKSNFSNMDDWLPVADIETVKI